MKEKIMDVISEITGLSKDELEIKIDKDTPQWDSLTKVEIIMALEDEFDITFEENEMQNMRNVDNIFEIMAEKRK